MWSEWRLDSLLLEGHCFESGTGNPPRGLQLTLGTTNHPEFTDTIVMANLGYLQLKAAPGAWFLALREGRSKEIYDIVSQENSDSRPGSKYVQVSCALCVCVPRPGLAVNFSNCCNTNLSS